MVFIVSDKAIRFVFDVALGSGRAEVLSSCQVDLGGA
jgi:hypothetical protein